MRSSPFFQILLGDARAYDVWARQIASGDWIGRDVFYQAPLYAYFLAVLYTIHDSLQWVRVCQAVVGACACVLIGHAAYRLFGRTVGLVAGLMLASYAPSVFFGALVQKSVLDVFFICLLLALLSGAIVDAEVPDGAHTLDRDQDNHRRARRTRRNVLSASSTGSAVYVDPASTESGRVASDSRWRWLGIGVTLGALALTRENALIFVPVVVGWMCVRPSLRKRRAGACAAMLAGLSVILLPVGLRNLIVGSEFHLTTTQSGPNFFIGNSPHADGTYVSLRFGRGSPEYERQDATELASQAAGGRALSPGDVSDYWTGRALDYIRTHPLEWLALEGRKLWLLSNVTEVVDTESQESHEDHSPLLRVLARVAHFGVLLPLACLGIWITSKDRRRLWLLHAMIGGYVLSVLAFYVVARYRLPLVPFLIVFAAAGVVRAGIYLESVLRNHLARRPGPFGPGSAAGPRGPTLPAPGPRKSKRMASASVGLLSLAALTVFCNIPLVSADAMRAVTYQNLGAALQETGRIDEAAAAYRRALSVEPDYAPAQNGLGSVLRQQGRLDEAVSHLEEALRRVPDFDAASFNLANALSDEGRVVEAIARYEDLLRRPPESVDVHANLGIALAKADRLDEAIGHFRRVVALAPETAKGHYNLGHSLLTRGDLDAAVEELSRAVQIDPADATARYELGNGYLAQQRFASAVEQFREVVRLTPRLAEGHNNLGIALGSAGRVDEAIQEFRRALQIDPGSSEAQANLKAALAVRQRTK